jgi:hypothetical protein
MIREESHIGKAKASKTLERFIPNPKLKLLDQVSEVMRFKHPILFRPSPQLRSAVQVADQSKFPTKQPPPLWNGG